LDCPSSSGLTLLPSSGLTEATRISAISARVGNRSIAPAICGIFKPGRIRPGQRIRNGTRKPPSSTDPLRPIMPPVSLPGGWTRQGRVVIGRGAASLDGARTDGTAGKGRLRAFGENVTHVPGLNCYLCARFVHLAVPPYLAVRSGCGYPSS